eukprot:9179949-Pyramimonas_sp.AAC.1
MVQVHCSNRTTDLQPFDEYRFNTGTSRNWLSWAKRADGSPLMALGACIRRCRCMSTSAAGEADAAAVAKSFVLAGA